MKKIEDFSIASDEELLNELVYWFRVGRTENGLKGDERSYFKELTSEVEKRKLLHV
jgi:hypothetical protein